MSKRGNGEGSITRRKDGLYMARYTVETPAGTKRKAIYAKTRKEAAEKLTKALSERAVGIVYDDENTTVGEYLDRWLKDVVRGTVRESTFSRDEYLVRNHIKPTLGRRKLRKLSALDLQGLYRDRLDSGLSGRRSRRSITYFTRPSPRPSSGTSSPATRRTPSRPPLPRRRRCVRYRHMKPGGCSKWRAGIASKPSTCWRFTPA